MDRRHSTPHDLFNSFNSYQGSFDSSNDCFNSSSYRSDDYLTQFHEAPPSPQMQQSHAMFTLPCSFCQSCMHMARDCYHLHGEVPPSHHQWLGQQHQMGNPYHNTDLGWNEHQNFQRDEGYNYGAPNYQWGSSSYFEMPNLPTMTASIQHSPPPIEQESNLATKEYLQLVLKALADHSSKLDEMFKIKSESPSTPEKSTEASSSQLERLEEQHLEDFVLRPALDMSEQQHRVHEPSVECSDSEDVDETIEVDDRPPLIAHPPSSPPCDDRLILLMIQWLVDQTVLDGSELDQDQKEEEEFREKEDARWDPSPEQDRSTLETAEVSKYFPVLEPDKVQEESPTPPLPQSSEQLEPKIEPILTPPPFIVDFVFPSQSFHTPPCLYDFISLCDADVKEARTEEYFSDQREGNTLGSLQRRRLLPLWIFKENLKPD